MEVTTSGELSRELEIDATCVELGLSPKPSC